MFDKKHLQSKIKRMKISISDIENNHNKVADINFSEIIEEFNDELPVNATLKVEIISDYVKIKGNIKATLKLICDVCLKEFEEKFDINVEEFFTKTKLNEDEANEFEIKNDGFIEDLNGEDEIDLTDFIYQCVTIHIPNKIVCDINCNGDENLEKYLKENSIDPRLEIFKQIKIKEKDN